MRCLVPGYVFISDRQAVIDAVAGVIPKEQWVLLHNVTKALLTAVIACHDRPRYSDPDGVLKCSLNKVFVDLFGQDSYLNSGIHTAMLRRGMLKTNGERGKLYRSRIVVTPAVQECLDDLAGMDKLANGQVARRILDKADQLVAELGREQAVDLIHALRDRVAICLPRS